MKEQEFIAVHEQEWQLLEQFFFEKNKKELLDHQIIRDFPFTYRRLCEQLAYADAVGFSIALVDRLNRLAIEGNRYLYRRRKHAGESVANFFLYQLPQAVRKQWRYFLCATALFLLPAFTGLALGVISPEIAADYGERLEEMYEPDADRRIGESRGAGSDVQMFGFYLMHNTSIGLRTVAGGALLGVGVVVSLVFNGWLLGVASAHMLNLGYAWITFFPFVITHAAFELTAIVFSGACGLALARGIFMPGRKRRGDAVREMLQAFFPVLVAVVLMFFMAAAIEAFWSAIWMPPYIKFLTGGVAWLLVLSYFLLAGRGYGSTVD